MKLKRKKQHQLLADSLRIAKNAAKDGVLRSDDLKRIDRERLIKRRYLTEVIRGWYLFSSPDNAAGSTAWFSGFWAFNKQYLEDRFGKSGYCISAESSLSLLSGDSAIPKQLIVLTKKESNSLVDLLFDTSIFLRTERKGFPSEIELYNGLPVMTASTALCRIGPAYFKQNPQNIEVILKIISVSDVSRALLHEQSISAAERIIGAYLHFGEKQKAFQIQEDMEAVGYRVSQVNPFDEYTPELGASRIKSAHAARVRLLWNTMRPVIEKNIPLPKKPLNINSGLIEQILDSYVKDAYHSLSIEGYHVTEALIEKVDKGNWDPEHNESDRDQKDALAAKGYSNAFKAVVKSIKKISTKKTSGIILEDELQSWYRELFTPFLQANLLRTNDISGYRNKQVFISGSRHVPPRSSSVIDCMEVFFELLKNEKNAAVRAILGHFIFVYIHPYMDGNGRIGRFIMNFMFVSGGLPWTVLRVENRAEYMAALEKASTEGDIEPFTRFVKSSIGIHWNDFTKKHRLINTKVKGMDAVSLIKKIREDE